MKSSDSEELTDLALELELCLEKMSGATTSELRSLRQTYSKRLASQLPKSVLGVAQHLLARPTIERRFMAYELINRHRPTLCALRARDLVRLGKGIDGWGATDTFACYLAGPAWREHQVPDRLIHSWLRSRDRWWRRAAVVSTVPLNNRARGGRGDTPRTLMVCSLAAADRDDMVVKALSWALRELVKRDPGAVQQFLRDQQGKVASRVVREVENKLRTGLKNPRKVKP